MATAYLYSFNKRRNSTALPTNSSGRAVTLVLKDGTSLTDPTFILSSATRPTENYIQFEGRYYHVLEITSIRQGIWGFNCHVDVLATYKSNIQASSAYVAYDTTTNTEITDSRLSTKTTTTRAFNVATDSYDLITTNMDDFTIILNVVGETSCATYALTIGNATGLLTGVKQWAEDVFSNIGQIKSLAEFGELCSEFFQKLLSNDSAASCIKSAYMLPINYSLVVGTSEEVVLGQFPTGVDGKRLTKRIYSDANGVLIPWRATDWRRNSPYHEIYLYLPFVGLVSYPASALIGSIGLYMSMGIDITNGDTIITVSSDSTGDNIIGCYNTNISMQYAIGSAAMSSNQMATYIAGGALGAIATMATGGAAAAVAVGSATISGEMNAIQPLATSIGGAGGAAALGLFGGISDALKMRCMVIFHDTTVSPDSVSAFMGTPTMAVKSLSGLSGYVETRLFSVSGTMLENERIEINHFMDGGVYIE